MHNQEFDYQFTEILCPDLKIIFITDENTTIASDSDVHMHAFWELFYLQEGKLSVATDTQNFELCKNQALLIPPNAYHSTKFDSGSVKTSVFFAFEKIKTKDSDVLFDEVQRTFSRGGFLQLSEPYIGHLLEMFFENHSGSKTGKLWRIKSIITELIFYLYDSIKGDPPLRHHLPMQQNTYWLYKYAIDRLLDIHYTNDISLEELSEKLSISPQYVTKIISSAYGKSFNMLKLELKMRNAKKLLRETTLSVNEIGTRIGYTSARGFLSAFLKYEKCTPSEYRKKYNNI